jgi:2-polyprenyl-3-methyl-5-hydroxy-6-metoxy-1,4-benzoquinol methylase
MAFACSALTEADVRGKTVIEAGALNVNGSVRPHVESLGPASYVATDMRTGPGVDVACAAEDLPAQFTRADAGTLYRERFEVVISTEMLEHASDWQAAMTGMIHVLAPGGVLVLTTRSEGFPVHGYPEDHWRYSVEAMGQILKAAGLDVERLEPDPDPQSPGVFAKARKPAGWSWPEETARAWGDVQVTRP